MRAARAVADLDLVDVPWTRVAELAARERGFLALLPLGAIEAHGPHLPFDTDTRIAVHLARLVAERLEREGLPALVAPPMQETAATFAASFPGTVSIDPALETRLLVERARALAAVGASRVVLVNVHFDPAHVRAVKDAVGEIAKHGVDVAWPDFTRRENVARIGGEFATGACHAGEFETSLLLVAAPHLVESRHLALPARDVNLAQAIRDGKRSFAELGLTEAYCGHPATASREEGERLYDVLAGIVHAEATRAARRA